MLPAVVGIGALVQFLIRIVEWFVTKFAARVTMQLAVSLAWITFYIGLLVAMSATFVGLLAGLSITLPSSLAEGLGLVKPSNLEPCLAAVYSAKVCVWVFQHKKQLIDWERNTGGYGRAGRVIGG